MDAGRPTDVDGLTACPPAAGSVRGLPWRRLLRRLSALLGTAVSLLAAGSAWGQVAGVPVGPIAGADVESGGVSVRALAVGAGNALYAAGSFGGIAARTGSWVRFGGSGARDPAWPEVNGSVEAVAPDGAGGWFIGGFFTQVGGQLRARLAHIGANGELDPAWRPAVTGRARVYNWASPWEPGVTALSVVGDTLYVGGVFASIGGQARTHLAAVNARTGEPLPWNPRPDAEVNALAAAGGTVYVGGRFTRVGPVSRLGIAAFDAATGAMAAWSPGVSGRVREATDPVVTELVVDRGRLYVGGRFGEIGGQGRYGLAAFELTTGALARWTPRGGEIEALAVSGDTVYAGGSAMHFSGLGFEEGGMAAFDARTGRSLPGPEILGDEESEAFVSALAVVGDRLYVGGSFASIGGQRRRNLGVISVTGGEPVGWDPRPSGQVRSLAAAGDGVLVGGAFSGLDSRPRGGLAAIALDGATLLPFAPNPSLYGYAAGMEAIAVQGDAVFAAGDFDWIGGRRGRSLARLDARTGWAARRFDADVSAPRRGQTRAARASVHALAVHGRRLYVGGNFARIGGRRRHNLAALDTSTGRAKNWRADANGHVRALAIEGQTLYVAGDFTRLDGLRRRHVAAIDLPSGRVTAWRPNPDGRVRALAFAEGTVYLGGDFSRVAGQRRTGLAAVNATDGATRPWRADANRAVHAVAVVDASLYAGGDFTSVNGAPRAKVAAVDARTGALSTWNPGSNGRVSALLTTPAGLVAAGSFTSLGGTNQTGLGIFPPATQPPGVSVSNLQRP